MFHERILGFMFGSIIFTIFWGISAIWYWTNTPTYQAGIFAKDQINKCESSIPRNQVCELKAVPVVNTKEIKEKENN